MDLSTINTKLQDGSYQSKEDVEKDFNLMISNCKLFNPKESPIQAMAQQLACLFRREWDAHFDEVVEVQAASRKTVTENQRGTECTSAPERALMQASTTPATSREAASRSNPSSSTAAALSDDVADNHEVSSSTTPASVQPASSTPALLASLPTDGLASDSMAMPRDYRDHTVEHAEGAGSSSLDIGCDRRALNASEAGLHEGENIQEEQGMKAIADMRMDAADTITSPTITHQPENHGSPIVPHTPTASKLTAHIVQHEQQREPQRDDLQIEPATTPPASESAQTPSRRRNLYLFWEEDATAIEKAVEEATLNPPAAEDTASDNESEYSEQAMSDRAASPSRLEEFDDDMGVISSSVCSVENCKVSSPPECLENRCARHCRELRSTGAHVNCRQS
jgi:hypothetical protein